MPARFDAHAHAYEEQTRASGMIYVLLLVVALAFSGFVWQLYSDTDVPRIAAAPGPYKVEPSSLSAPDGGEQGGGSASATTPAEVRSPPETAESAIVAAAPPVSAGAVSFSPSGPYVAQLAALQSEAAVDQAWRRFSSRAPALFATARLDMERADLGARGVYYRVRAGYFADRAAAARFCDRIREFGQDCIPATR